MTERVRVRVAALLGVLALSTGTVAGGALWLAAQPAAALTNIAVTTNADPGVAPACPGSNCTLRQAFATASATAGDVEIDIPASTINLTAGELLYNGSANLSVAGNGTTITQGNSARIIHFTSLLTLTVSGLTLIGGENCRGGIDASSGSVVVTNTTVTQATSTCGGGGIYANGSVAATGSTVSSSHANFGSGGGIETGTGTVTLTNSTVTTNTARDGGGGIAAGENLDGTPQAMITLTNSTVDHNTASQGGNGDGGGVEGGQLAATNSTITNNSNPSTKNPPDVGGGVAMTELITLTYVTIASNTDPTGANIGGDGGGNTTLTSVASVVALPLGGGSDCSNMATTTQGYNWSDDVSCGFGAGPGDHSNAGDPLLGALANNGGPTQTRLPQDGPSPLIDAIPVSACQTGNAAGVTTDQRGISRPQGAGCDIGAVEVGVITAAPLTAAFTG